jgi:O-antigen ligase
VAFVYDRGPARKTLVGLTLVPAALALVLTVGRGLWISVAVGLCILAGLVVLDRHTVQSRARRMLILILLPLLVVGVGYLFQQITRTGVAETAMRRVSRAMDYEEDYAVAARMVSYGFTVEKIKQRPFLGGGHGATVSYIQTDEAVPYVFTTGTVDNLYLTLMLRMGIVGLVAFLWIFLRAGRVAYRLFQRSEDPTVRLFCAAFLTVYGAMLVYGMADATMMSNRLIFFHATFLGILARLDRESEDGTPA